MAIVVELLARNGKPIKHYYFDKPSISIGRGYHNDLTLEDPYVCADHLHAKLDNENGVVDLEDQASLNGTKVNNRRVGQRSVSPDDEIILGRTRLHIFDANQDVPRTLPLSELEENISWMNSFFWAITLTLAFAATLILSEYLMSFDEFKLSKALPKLMGQMALFSAWPLILSLLAKLAKKESRMLSQFSLLWIFLISLQVLSNVERFFEFNFSHAQWVFWMSVLALSACAFIFIWFSLFVAFHQSKQRRNLVSAIATAILIIPAVTFQILNKQDFSAKPSYSASLLPLDYYFIKPTDTETFLNSSEKLFNKVDASIQSRENENP